MPTKEMSEERRKNKQWLDCNGWEDLTGKDGNCYYSESTLLYILEERVKSNSVALPSKEFIKDKYELVDSWGNTGHPDECYQQGVEDMYEAIQKELNK